jgi:glycosyltransferase involved in cell wall biosynthesis
MGLELAERRLLEALRQISTELQIKVRVVGGRGARRHARNIDARWIPARKSESLPASASFGASIVHLLGLDVPPPRRGPFIVTIHDLAPLRYPDEGNLPSWAEEIRQRASLLLTPSAFTRKEVSELWNVPPERIRVIGGGPVLDARDAHPLTTAELRRLGIRPPFVLRYGGYTARKNVPLLLEAWSTVATGSLVLSGPPQDQRARLLAEAPSLDRVTVLDYVSTEMLGRLLKSAAALVTTSAYEGFGLPPLEALSAGVTVIAVAAPFVREVCGDSVRYVEASPEALGAAMSEVLENTRATREKASFLAADSTPERMWQDTAGRVVAAYRSVGRAL